MATVELATSLAFSVELKFFPTCIGSFG